MTLIQNNGAALESTTQVGFDAFVDHPNVRAAGGVVAVAGSAVLIVTTSGAGTPAVYAVYGAAGYTGLRGAEQIHSGLYESAFEVRPRDYSHQALDLFTGDEDTTNQIFNVTDVGVVVLELGARSVVALSRSTTLGIVTDSQRLTYSARMEAVRKLGNAGEEAAQIAKNTRRIESLSGTVRYRIPDELTTLRVREVKIVAELPFTAQIRDLLHYSIMTDREFVLVVRRTTQLSPPLQDAVRAGWIRLEFLP